jgi:hypothetical protein
MGLIVSRYDSFIVNGIRAILPSGHAGQITSRLISRIVALQKHDSQSAK